MSPSVTYEPCDVNKYRVIKISTAEDRTIVRRRTDDRTTKIVGR